MNGTRYSIYWWGTRIEPRLIIRDWGELKSHESPHTLVIVLEIGNQLIKWNEEQHIRQQFTLIIGSWVEQQDNDLRASPIQYEWIYVFHNWYVRYFIL